MIKMLHSLTYLGFLVFDDGLFVLEFPVLLDLELLRGRYAGVFPEFDFCESVFIRISFFSHSEVFLAVLGFTGLE